MMYDDIAYYYHLTHQQLDEDIPFILAMAAEAGGAVLELGCGTGRVLLPLARAGYTAVGIDLSAQMLAIARAQIGREDQTTQQRIQLKQADMSDFHFPAQRFGLCLIPYNTVMHLTNDAFQRCLRKIKAVLKPNGRLLIDTVNPHALAEIEDQPKFVLENRIYDQSRQEEVAVYGRYKQLGDQQLSLTWRFQTPTKQVDGESIYHYRYPHQLQLALQQNGFRLEKIIGDYEHRPFSEDSERCIILASA